MYEVLDMMHSGKILALSLCCADLFVAGVCSITHAGERMISRLAASFSISYGCTKMLGEEHALAYICRAWLLTCGET